MKEILSQIWNCKKLPGLTLCNLFSSKLSHDSLGTYPPPASFNMAASVAISMYSLPTFYDNVEVPLPKNMYNLPSYYEPKVESMVSRVLVASFSLKKEQLLHVGITFMCVFTNQFYYQAYIFLCRYSHRVLQRACNRWKKGKTMCYWNSMD